ncbi:MAG: class I SAM-dependent methyltransferase [Anaeromyxobacteraceae bacterium]
MRKSLLFRLLEPVGGAVGRQLARPHGWFGRAVMTRALNRGNRELIEATLEGLALAPDCRLLDVGFGGGALLAAAHRRGVGALAGVDPSADAVAWLRGRRRALGGAALRVELGAVEALPFPDASFDLVASTNTVYFWPDLARAFSELARVLRPGGILTIGYSGGEKLRSHGGITRHGFHFHADADLVAEASRAGFADVRVTALHGRVTEGDAVLRAVRAGA